MAPSSSPFPSEKLLITDLKPKSDPNPASSSSTTSAPPPEKRTRDLPNLSDCHCCSRRINYTNPKDRLQPLDSVWRIVLVCKRCRESLRSGKKCPYCFQETGNSGDLLTCRGCQRKIHRNCVRDYGNCTPWSYLGVGLEGFRVCVDCWVPEPLKSLVRVPGRCEIKDGLKDKREAIDLLENGARDAKCGVEKKVKRALKAKVNVLRMANGDMNSVNMEDDGSDLSAEKDCLKAGNSNGSDAVEVVDDKSLVNLSIGKWKGLCYERSHFRKIWCGDQKLETCDDGAENERMKHMENDPSSIELVPYKRDRRRKIFLLNNESVELESLRLDDPRTSNSMKSGADTSADSVCVDTDQPNGDKLGPQLVIYRRTRFKKESPMSGSLAVSRDSSYCDGHGVAFGPGNSQPDDTNLSSGSPAKSDIIVILPSESCDAERDRYQQKYFKRITGTNPCSGLLHFSTFLCVNQFPATDVSNSKAGGSVDNGELISPNGTCDQEADRYSLKYAKRVKSAKAGTNFEAESRTVSDAS